MSNLTSSPTDRSATYSFLVPLSASHPGQRIDFARRYGLGLEISAFVGGGPLNDGAKRAELEDELLRELDGFEGFRSFHGVFLDITVHSSDQKIAAIARERIERDLVTATRLGCSTVVFHLGFNPLVTGASYREEVIDRNAEFWRSAASAHPTLTIGLENQWEPDWSIFEELFRAIGNPRVGLCLDVAHAHIYSHFDLVAWAQKMRRHLVHMHWSDNCGESDRHAPLGDGNIRWESLFAAFDSWERVTVTLEMNHLSGLNSSLRFLEQRRLILPSHHISQSLG